MTQLASESDTLRELVVIYPETVSDGPKLARAIFEELHGARFRRMVFRCSIDMADGAVSFPETLEELEIGGFVNEKSDRIEDLLGGCESLRVLRIGSRGSKSAYGVCGIEKLFPNLERFEFEPAARGSVSDIGKLRKLRHLTIFPDAANIASLSGVVAQLETLRFGCSTCPAGGSEPDEGSRIVAATELVELHYAGPVHGSALCALAKSGLPKLRILSIGGGCATHGPDSRRSAASFFREADPALFGSLEEIRVRSTAVSPELVRFADAMRGRLKRVAIDPANEDSKENTDGASLDLLRAMHISISTS